MRTLDEVCRAWRDLQAKKDEVERAIFYNEQVIAAWMAQHKAERQESEGLTLEFKPTVVYDPGKLAWELKEVMTPEEFVKILTNPRPPDPKVNITKAKELAKLGEPYLSIVEASKRVEAPVLKIVRKEG